MTAATDEAGAPAQDDVAAQDKPSAGASSRPRSKASQARSRDALPLHLPRIEETHDIDDKSCPCCGAAMHKIGESCEEQLDIVPAQFRVTVIRRPKYGCRTCTDGVSQAPAPPRPIAGGMATETVIAHVLVGKYADHSPLYRQVQIYARQGIDLDRSTSAASRRAGVLVVETAVRFAVFHGSGVAEAVRRRHAGAGAGAGPRQDEDRAHLGVWP